MRNWTDCWHPDDPARREIQQAGRQGAGTLRESIWRREQELLIQHQLPLTETRVEMLVNLYLHFDCDLKAAFEDGTALPAGAAL
jgi:hypothetical protein